MGFSGGDDISHHLQMWSRVLIILLYHNFGVGLPQSLVNMDFQKLFSLRYVSTSHGRLIYNVKPSFLLVYSPNRLVCPHQSLEEVRFLSISSLWMLIYPPISVLDTYIETGVLVVNNGQFCREYRSLSKLFSAQGKSFSDDHNEKLGNKKPLGGLVRPLSTLLSANPHIWMVRSGVGITEKTLKVQKLRHVVLIICLTSCRVDI